MKQITKRFFYASLFFCALVLTSNLKAQTPYISITSGQTCFSAGNNTAMAAAVPAFSASVTYSWSTVGSSTACPVTFTPLGTNGSSISLNSPCCGTYTVNCAVYSGTNLVTTMINSYAVACAPVINVTSSPSGTSVCAGTSILLSASGVSTYTWNIGSTGTSIVVTPTASVCYTVTGTNASGCFGIATICKTILSNPAISISGPATVCAGSSASFSVGGGAVTYTWNTNPPVSGTTYTFIPTTGAGVLVTGVGANGCVGHDSVYVWADTLCAYVWPGDANSDGLVDNTDVLEIGLSYGMTGTARSPGGNAYTSQYASAVGWIGFGSTGKRRVHIDCNGDGTINMGDTVAIFNNYSLTHAFKPAETSSANSDISLNAPSSVTEGTWNKADIMLGSSALTMTQLYGLAFDINYDNSKIESNSVYIVYTSSFLNAANQNVQFRKTNFTAGKIYAASVRTNGADVSGDGKIGEFWFKVKSGLPANSVLNLSTSNTNKIGKTGVKTLLTNGTAAPSIVAQAVGLKENVLQNTLQFFPNPASDQLILKSGISTPVTYTLYDIVGRELVNGAFTTSSALDVSAFQNGTYIIRFTAGSETSYKKITIEK